MQQQVATTTTHKRRHIAEEPPACGDSGGHGRRGNVMVTIVIPVVLVCMLKYAFDSGYLNNVIPKHLQPRGSDDGTGRGSRTGGSEGGGGASTQTRVRHLMREMGVKVFGSDKCPWSRKQLEDLGIDNEDALFVDCETHADAPRANEISAYPTWLIGGELKVGYMAPGKAAGVLDRALLTAYNKSRTGTGAEELRPAPAPAPAPPPSAPVIVDVTDVKEEIAEPATAPAKKRGGGGNKRARSDSSAGGVIRLTRNAATSNGSAGASSNSNQQRVDLAIVKGAEEAAAEVAAEVAAEAAVSASPKVGAGAPPTAAGATSPLNRLSSQPSPTSTAI